MGCKTYPSALSPSHNGVWDAAHRGWPASGQPATSPVFVAPASHTKSRRQGPLATYQGSVQSAGPLKQGRNEDVLLAAGIPVDCSCCASSSTGSWDTPSGPDSHREPSPHHQHQHQHHQNQNQQHHSNNDSHGHHHGHHHNQQHGQQQLQEHEAHNRHTGRGHASGHGSVNGHDYHHLYHSQPQQPQQHPAHSGPGALLLTGVFDGHGGDSCARYAQAAILSLIANDRRLHASLGCGDWEATRSALKAAYSKVDEDILALAGAAAPSASHAAPQPAAATCASASTSVGPGGRATSTASDCAGAGGSSHAPASEGSCMDGAVSQPGPLTAALPPAASAGAGAGAGAAVCAGGASAAPYTDGTTALVALQLGGQLAVANAGDSRAVLCRGGQAVRLSRDHTPAVRAERERIEAAGGLVSSLGGGVARVLLPLAPPATYRACAVSRSLGDPDFKARGLLTAEPDVTLTGLEPGRDAYLIAASDGLWGALGDQEAVDVVAAVLEEYSHMSAEHRPAAPRAAAQRLLRAARDGGSRDDVTVVVSVFQWGPEEGEAQA